MRKVWDEFFHIPKHGKVREKVMLMHIVLAIGTAVMCLAAINFGAYAFFSHTVTSGSNVIKAAKFETMVSVRSADQNSKSAESVKPISGNEQSFKIEGLKVGKTYTVTVETTDNSTAKTGFITVSADDCSETYYTQQLGTDDSAKDGKTEKISFELMITDDAVVYLNAQWGTSSHYSDYQNKKAEQYITNGKKIKMIVNGVIDSIVNNTDITTDESTDSTTASTEMTTTSEETTTSTTGTTTSTTSVETEQPATTDTVPTSTEETHLTSQPTGTSITDVSE